MKNGRWLITKRLGVIVCIMAAAGSVGAADPLVEEKVKSIRAKYAEIERELKDCRQVKRDLPDESAEGGELVAYFKGSNLRKLSTKLFGETGNLAEEYYFAGNELIFVFRAETRFSGPNSGVVREKTEQRFYFADGKLIRWLDRDHKEVTKDSSKFERERELLASAKKYSAMVH